MANEIRKMSTYEVESSLRNNPYTAKVLSVMGANKDDIDAQDAALSRLDKMFRNEHGSILGTRDVKDGDTHIQHRFNPSAKGADQDIQRLHQIEVAQTLLNSLDCHEDRFYQKMSAAIQGQKLFGAGPTMATSLMRMRDNALGDQSPKERVTITAQF